jgi:hypothetical protein
VDRKTSGLNMSPPRTWEGLHVYLCAKKSSHSESGSRNGCINMDRQAVYTNSLTVPILDQQL